MLKFGYNASSKGYMLTYQGKNLGGAGTINTDKKHWRTALKDLADYKASAERDISELQAGRGQKRYWDVICRIDREELKNASANGSLPGLACA